MVDESAEAIVARLKAEGQLTRNSGTNSLKSLKNVQEQTNEKVSAVFEKMTNLFESINSSLLLQSSMLESLYNIQSDAYVMEKERIADEKRARLLSGDGKPGFFSTGKKSKPGENPEDPPTKKGLLSSIFGDIFKGGIGKIAIRAIGAGAAGFVITALIDGLKEGFGFGGEGEPVEGEPSVLKDIVLKTLPVGLGFFFRGIKGALIGGATAALLDMVEELTGFDIPDEIEGTISTLVGVGVGGGLIRRLLFLAVGNPIGLIITGMVGAILATKLLVENQKKVIEDQIKEVEDLTDQVNDTTLSIKERIRASDSATAQANRTSQMADPDTEIGKANTAANIDAINARAGLKEDKGDPKGAAEDRLRAAFIEAEKPNDKIKVLDDYIKQYPAYTGNSKGDRIKYFGDILGEPYTDLFVPKLKSTLFETLSQEDDWEIQPDTITSNPRKLTGANGRKARRREQKLSAFSDGSSTNFNVAKGGDSVNLTPVNNTTNNSYTTIVTAQNAALGNAIPIAFSA